LPESTAIRPILDCSRSHRQEPPDDFEPFAQLPRAAHELAQ
jgi:hypothetical protein